MRKTIQEELEDLRSFQRYPARPMPVPADADNDNADDYEDFEDGEMFNALWHRGEEASEDEFMSAEDY